MKAIVLKSFGGPENFQLQELPVPPLREGEIRVRVKAVSFNPVDHQIRKGTPEAVRLRSMILGRDFSGTVDAVHGRSFGGAGRVRQCVQSRQQRHLCPIREPAGARQVQSSWS